MFDFSDCDYVAADFDDEESTPQMYCKRCDCNVTTHWQDNGFDYSYGSINAYHRQDDLVCNECGDDVSEKAREIKCDNFSS